MSTRPASRRLPRPFRSLLALVIACGSAVALRAAADLTLPRWHTAELTFTGPAGSEDDPATFLDHRLTVTFHHEASGTRITIPGFFAADGDAGTTHATAGDQWRVRFTPGQTGTWTYQARLETGPRLAITNAPGTPVDLSPASGRITVTPTDLTPASPDFRAHGRLAYVGKHYRRFAGSGRYFLKGGAGSPENFLAFDGIDGTYDFAQTPEFPSLGADQLHHYGPHRRDWREGDPDWTDEDGHDAKGIIGLANYLGDQGINSLYFITLTYAGDGNDVWPWVDPEVRTTFDVSKLAQWEWIFAHLQHRGVHLNLLLTETENENLFELEDGPAPFADTRQLYYREMIARFGHHLAMTWNLGEENGWTDEKGGDRGIGNTHAQRQAFARYLRDLDPYDTPITVHEILIEEIYPQLAGFDAFEGPSLQRHENYNQIVIDHLRMSVAAGRPWLVSMDEPLGWEYGLRPDADDPSHDIPRRDVLWGVLMAGGYGVDWYAGWQNNAPTSDLSSEDLRVRATMWRQTRHVIDFFQTHVPFTTMTAANALAADSPAYVFAAPNDTYLVYRHDTGPARLDLTTATGTYTVRWFDPRLGGDLQTGTVTTVTAGDIVDLGAPPHTVNQDWAALVQRR